MIGWFVDVGYVIKSGNISSIDDIVFTDFNRPFGIFIKKDDYNYENTSGTIVSNKEPQETYIGLKEVIGDDADTCYILCTGYVYPQQQLAIDRLKYLLPSINLSFPNLYNAFIDYCNGEISDNFLPVIYFKSLNRIYIGNPSAVVSGIYQSFVYEVVSNKLNLLAASNNRGQFPAFYHSGPAASNFSFIILKEYFTGINLGDSNNYLERIFYITTGRFSRQNFEPLDFSLSKGNTWPATASKRFLSALFTNAVPDFVKTPVIPPTNPFDPIGPSLPGDLPPGTFDEDSDKIPDSSLPSLSASDTGFTRIYIPTLSQVQDLARYLWTDDTVIETIWNKIKQFFENPMEAIIGFNLVPVQVPSGGTKSFALMYIDTGVDMDTAANQFVDQDCGTLDIKPYYGSALDYSPYTKISCFLPYIGMVQLNTDEIMNSQLQVKYRIDIVSGSCVAKILVNGNVLYQYSGHCAITIPIASSDFSSYVSAAINVAKLAVGAATGGAAGAISAAANVDVAQQTGYVYQAEVSPQMGAIVPVGYASGLGPQQQPEQEQTTNTKASFSGLSPRNISNTVGEIMSAKPHVQHSGSFSGNSGYLGVRRPFIIIERPNLCMPENYQQLNGFPAMITMPLGECSGFTKVQQVQLTGMSATNPEQAEILELLKGGVIF